ncbi:MAG: hypothetical protein JO110_25675, partial [Acetobacteraceae bacterium]|nr:hypothetical protein [Acetobacteraceae bacterium]
MTGKAQQTPPELNLANAPSAAGEMPKQAQAAIATGEQRPIVQPQLSAQQLPQPPAAQVVEPAAQTEAGAVRGAIRVPALSGRPPWAPPPAASERVTLFGKRLADGRTAQLLRAAEQSGRAAIEALNQLRTGPSGAVLGKIEAAASIEQGGMRAVTAEMRPGGKYPALRDELTANKQLTGSLAKALQTAGKYGADRLAVAQNFENRGLDAQQLEARFGEADRAIGDSLSKLPGKEPGKTALDELAEKAAEIFRKAMQRIPDSIAPNQDAASEETNRVAWRNAWIVLGRLVVVLGLMLVWSALISPFTEIAKIARLMVALLYGIVFDAWPQYSPESWGGMIVALGSPLLFGISGSALIVLGNRAMLRAGEQATANDSRRPVVYLRPFAGDRDMARRPLSFGRLFAIKTEEQQLIEVLRDIGPVFAIGKPGERLPLLGASRLYFEGEEWRRQVVDWFSRAALIAVRLPVRQTPGILWELSLSLS